MDAYPLTQAQVACSRYGLLRPIMDDFLEYSRCEDYANGPTGRATPWPNRAETAVRLFKSQCEKLLMDAWTHLALNKATLCDLIRQCWWAQNTTLTITLLWNWQKEDDRQIILTLCWWSRISFCNWSAKRRSTLRTQEARCTRAPGSSSISRDLVRRVLPSDGPYAHGDRVFVWIDDKAKYKAVGRWARRMGPLSQSRPTRHSWELTSPRSEETLICGTTCLYRGIWKERTKKRPSFVNVCLFLWNNLS